MALIELWQYWWALLVSAHPGSVIWQQRQREQELHIDMLTAAALQLFSAENCA